MNKTDIRPAISLFTPMHMSSMCYVVMILVKNCKLNLKYFPKVLYDIKIFWKRYENNQIFSGQC